MEQSIINRNSISFTNMKDNIVSYLASLNNYEEIKDALPDSTLTVVTELMAGFASFNAHQNQMMRQETYLSTAKLETSVYNIAKAFGYYIDRATAPVIKLKYLAVPSMPLKAGTIVGKYGDQDILYFGEDRIIEKLDEVDFVVGFYNSLEQQVQLVNGEFILTIYPELLKSVDNEHIQLFVNDNPRPLSKAIEDFVVHQKAVDYSLDVDVSKMFLSDMDNQYGLVVSDKSDVIKVKFLETNGYLPSIVPDEVKLDEEFMYLSTSHLGTNGESLEKIKRLAPLFYSTLRRAVTADDLSYISEAHHLLSSAYAERDLGTPLKEQLSLISWVSQDYSVNIKGVIYTMTTTADDTQATALQKLYDLVKNNIDSIAELDLVAMTITITAVDSRAGVFFIVSSANIDKVTIDENITPVCCTAYVYYVKYDTVNLPIAMTPYELEVISDYLYKFKMIGLRVVFTPAGIISKDFKVKINLSNADYYEQVLAELVSLLSKYELRLNTGFNYGEVLVALSKISVYNGDELVYPVLSVIPNQEIYDIAINKYNYLKFQNIEIELV